MPNIEIYTKAYCPFCIRAKSTLTELGARYREIEISHDREGFNEMVERSNRKTVPQIFIDGLHLGGSDDLEAARSSGELEQLLAEDPSPA